MEIPYTVPEYIYFLAVWTMFVMYIW